jgi:WD40 repeat protein
LVLASGVENTFFYLYDSGSLRYRSKLIGTIAGYSDDALDIDANQVLTYSEIEKALYLWRLPEVVLVTKAPVPVKPQKVGFRGHQAFYIQWDESNLKFITSIGPDAEPPVKINVRDWRIQDAELNQNGRVLLVPSETKAGTAAGIHTVTLWDAASGISLADLYGQTNLVEDATFSPDNRRIATAYHCGVLVFECPGCLGGDELIAEAKRLNQRP